MRDLLLTTIVFSSIPIILARPYVGILMWSWLGYMNPHRLSWGFAYEFAFAQLVGVVTLISLTAALLTGREKLRIPVTGLTMVWFAFILWMNVTTLFSLNPDYAWMEWDRTMKIQLISIVTLILINSRERINMLVWTIALSLGFFGIKGGVFSIVTGGKYLVFGPDGSFIEDNNAIALALIMTLPLFRYLQLTLKERWLVIGLAGGMALIGLAILTSHSRGAFLAGSAMVFALWLKSRHKMTLGLLMLLAIPVLLSFMPAEWFERMSTISAYEEDGSAMGRINAWYFAWYLALDRPFVGGGFQTFTQALFLTYAPDPLDFHDSHSIYFEVLGEHGFVGLGLFLALGVLALMNGGRIIRLTKKIPELQWARDLASMLQVSLIGYAVGGLFLGLAYFDLYYHLVALIVVLRALVEGEVQTVRAQRETEQGPAAVAGHRGIGVTAGSRG